MTHRARNTTAGYRKQLKQLADQGNPLAARYHRRLKWASDPDTEATRIRNEVAAIMANVARVGRILDDAIRRPHED